MHLANNPVTGDDSKMGVPSAAPLLVAAPAGFAATSAKSVLETAMEFVAENGVEIQEGANVEAAVQYLAAVEGLNCSLTKLLNVDGGSATATNCCF